MDAYIYKAALYCENCGEDIRESLTKAGFAPKDPEDEYSYDSDDFPKGPFSDGGGEADYPCHCNRCGVFLKNPLTPDGYGYVRERLTENHTDVATKWADFYDIAAETEEEED